VYTITCLLCPKSYITIIHFLNTRLQGFSTTHWTFTLGSRAFVIHLRHSLQRQRTPYVAHFHEIWSWSFSQTNKNCQETMTLIKSAQLSHTLLKGINELLPHFHISWLMLVKFGTDFRITGLRSCELCANQLNKCHTLLTSTNEFLPIKKVMSSINTMKTHTGSRGTDPLILNLGTRWTWVVNFMLRLL